MPRILEFGAEMKCCPRCGGRIRYIALEFRTVERHIDPRTGLITARPARITVVRDSAGSDVWKCINEVCGWEQPAS